MQSTPTPTPTLTLTKASTPYVRGYAPTTDDVILDMLMKPYVRISSAGNYRKIPTIMDKRFARRVHIYICLLYTSPSPRDIR